MKAILGNFRKISETEFHLKKTLQFAQVALNEDSKVVSVKYKDSENIDIGDLLNHNSVDYEIKSIDADNFDKLIVTVEKIDQPEQDVPDKSEFVPRKMTPREPKPTEMTIPIPQQPNVKEEHIAIVEQQVIDSDNKVMQQSRKDPKTSTKVVIPKKKNMFKKFAGWISSKLSSYSNS